MNEPTIEDVIAILQRHPDNINARRFLKDPKALQQILDSHISWNADHAKFNEPEMVFPLETNVEYAMDVPESIDQLLRDEKERP